ncbi:GNAT family N-acetyltransferase [Mesobacillus selenatarsenatis]|uniref:GNAT family N-acetyltransferase n=1 Tax=Mesobacillus selenatarsenatis TaxID=388741 RepID=A0A846TLV1_9BACI|nr:GNAT family N-acetyltransferase [Mesobacillus selenatarsenatis]NKE06612.1 GNAT family N-acetyltransferase [Mesobacillus selenatarsenatis]
MEIRIAREDDIKDIVFILDAASLALLNKGVNQWDYPWDENHLMEQVGCLHVASVDEKIIGTFGIKDLKEWHVPGPGKYLFQIAIHPDFQGIGYGATFLSWACKQARTFREDLYLDCWAGNEKLKNFYSGNGFEYVGDFPEEDYYISIFKSSRDG